MNFFNLEIKNFHFNNAMIFGFFFLTVCPDLSASKKYFKDNKNDILKISKIHVATDTMLTGFVEKEVPGLNQEYNINLGNRVFSDVTEMLNNYLEVEFNHVISAVGLYLKGKIMIPDLVNPEEYVFLPFIEPREQGAGDYTLKVLEPIFENTHAYTGTFSEQRKYVKKVIRMNFNSINDLGLEEHEAVLIINTSGLRSPPKGTGGKTILSAIVTLGHGIYFSITPKYMGAILINHEGKVMWAGASRTASGLRGYNLNSLLYHTFKTMPFDIKNPNKKITKKSQYSNFKRSKD